MSTRTSKQESELPVEKVFNIQKCLYLLNKIKDTYVHFEPQSITCLSNGISLVEIQLTLARGDEIQNAREQVKLLTRRESFLRLWGPCSLFYWSSKQWRPWIPLVIITVVCHHSFHTTATIKAMRTSWFQLVPKIDLDLKKQICFFSCLFFVEISYGITITESWFSVIFKRASPF